MRLVVSTEQRFHRTPDGSFWAQTVSSYPFWTRYLEVFDEVRIFARVRDEEKIAQGLSRADGEGVSLLPVPEYLGPYQYARKARRVRGAARGVVRSGDAVILRLPSQLSLSLEADLRRTGHPYGVEVVGDPYDVFAPGAVRNTFRPFFRWWFSRTMRRQCAGAVAAAYVTRDALQKRYPCAASSGAAAPGRPAEPGMTSYSSIQLEGDAFTGARRRTDRLPRRARLIFVGSLAQLYKGPDVLIDALALAVQGGLDVQLAVLGDGRFRPGLQERVRAAGLADRVAFLGQVPAGDPVRACLDQADLFVLPSKTEGLPRAMIEAMARGLPCIGTTVGGIPELLPDEDLVPPGDPGALAGKISEVLRDGERMEKMSVRNFARSLEYREEVLRERRVAFYRRVRSAMENWALRRSGSA